MTVSDFLNILNAQTNMRQATKVSDDDLSWTVGEEFGESDDVLLRKNCARILHRYMQKVLGEKDATEGLVSNREVRDIYDCRICAVHIVQVLTKGIMQTVDINGLRLFDGNREVSEDEALLYIERMLRTVQGNLST